MKDGALYTPSTKPVARSASQLPDIAMDASLHTLYMKSRDFPKCDSVHWTCTPCTWVCRCKSASDKVRDELSNTGIRVDMPDDSRRQAFHR